MDTERQMVNPITPNIFKMVNQTLKFWQQPIVTYCNI